MSWLTEMTDEVIANFPRPVFAPSVLFDFDDVRETIAMVEGSIIAKQKTTQAERRATAMKAAADPFYNWVEQPVFAPMGVALWKSALTFPRILRGALLIAICSHVEHVLREWCELLKREWSPLRTIPKKRKRESDVGYCMRYLRDAAGLAVGDFERWDEWKALDAYRVARNCLAHNGGLVPRKCDRAKLVGLLHLKVELFGLLAEEPAIYLDAGACEAAADTARVFFDRLTQICQKDPRAKRGPEAT